MKSFEHFSLQYGFRDGAHFCAFRIEEGEREIRLLGEERIGETVLSLEELSFSPQEHLVVKRFACALAESKTHPRMMRELAEEYFSSADLE